MSFDVSSMYSLEAEQMVLGGVLISPAKFEDVRAKVSGENFFLNDNRQVFEVMRQISESGEEPELGAVADRLTQINAGKNWWADLAILAKNTPSSLNVVMYAEKVREYARLREMYKSLTDVQQGLIDGSVPLEDRIAQAQKGFMELDSGEQHQGLVKVCDVMKEYYEHVERCFQAGEGITGLRTGFDAVDKRLGGLQPGQLVVIAARPAMGKTSMALNISRYVSLTENKNVSYFSLEMSKEELLDRVISDYGNIPYKLVRSAQFCQDDMDYWPRFSTAFKSVNEASLYIDDKAGLSVSEIASSVTRLHRKVKQSLVIIDHLHLIQGEGESDTSKVTNTSRTLKRLAKSLNVPVIVLCQLNRSCEGRPDKRPMMSDLRQSGAIEEDADLIGFIYRDVVYNEKTPYPHVAELIWRKARNAETGTDWFNAQLAFQRFVSCEEPVQVVEFSKQKQPRRKVL